MTNENSGQNKKEKNDSQEGKIPLFRVRDKNSLSPEEQIVKKAIDELGWAIEDRRDYSKNRNSPEELMFLGVKAVAVVNRSRASKLIGQVLNLRIEEERKEKMTSKENPGPNELKIKALRAIAEILSTKQKSVYAVWISGDGNRLETYYEAGEGLVREMLRSQNETVNRLIMDLASDLVDAEVISNRRLNELYEEIRPEEYKKLLKEMAAVEAEAEALAQPQVPQAAAEQAS